MFWLDVHGSVDLGFGKSPGAWKSTIYYVPPVNTYGTTLGPTPRLSNVQRPIDRDQFFLALCAGRWIVQIKTVERIEQYL